MGGCSIKAPRGSPCLIVIHTAEHNAHIMGDLWGKISPHIRDNPPHLSTPTPRGMVNPLKPEPLPKVKFTDAGATLKLRLWVLVESPGPTVPLAELQHAFITQDLQLWPVWSQARGGREQHKQNNTLSPLYLPISLDSYSTPHIPHLVVDKPDGISTYFREEW